ncbi:unnamed protein product [Camellia sinensis]
MHWALSGGLYPLWAYPCHIRTLHFLCQTPNLSSISLDPAYITCNTMQDFIGSVCRSLVFKPSDNGGVFKGFVEKIGSIICKSGIGLFSKPPVPALPPIAKSDAINVKKDDALTIRWRKGELISCGTFGRVYMGLNIDSGALLAIKQKTQAHIRELEEEVNLLENLSHPNIVASLNILLEIVPGGSISSFLGKFGSFPKTVIRMYTKQLLLGMEYLHRNGIMHRDIKGANILVDNKGCIKLADSGTSKKVVELATMTGAKSMKGTPYWMALEVILQTGHSLLISLTSNIPALLIYGVLDVRLLRWLHESLLGASSIRRYVAALFHIGTTKSHPPILEHLSAEAIDFLLKCLQKEPNLRPAASDLLQHPFVTREYQETYPVLRTSVMDVHNSVRCSTIYPEKFPGSVLHWGSGNCDDDMCQIDDEDDLAIGASAKFNFALLSDDFNRSFNPMFEPADNWLCKSDDTLEKFPGSVPHWGSGNCDDDMCQIDDEDDLVIGASAKFDSALLSDDFNKSFNPMSEPDDNWPCKSDDTPELESRVNLFSGQTVNKATDIPRASGKGNNDSTFPCGPLVAEDDDDDEVIESKIRAFLDEKGFEVDYSGSGNCDDDMCQINDEDNLLIGASTKFDFALLSDDFNKSCNPMFEPDDNWPCKSDNTLELEIAEDDDDDDDDDEVVVAKYGWVEGVVFGKGGADSWSRCLERHLVGLGAVNVAYTASSGTYSQCVSNIGNESVQTLSQVQPPKPGEWIEVVHDDQELINPSTSFYERKIIWEEGLCEELERKRVITIWVSIISFHAYAEITFQSTSDGGKGDYRSEICSPDLLSRKERYCSKTPLMGTTVILTGYLSCGGHHACQAPIQSIGTSCSYPCRCNPIDITDPRWEILLIVQKKIDLQGGNQLRLLGFAAIYRFVYYPDNLPLQLSQIVCTNGEASRIEMDESQTNQE